MELMVFPKEKPPRPWSWQAQAGECFKARVGFFPALFPAFRCWAGFQGRAEAS